GVDQRAGNLDQASESIRLARSLPLGKVVLLLETNAAIDLQRVLTLSPDACLININSRDVLLKALELTLVSERLFVFGNSVAIRMKQDNSDYGLVPSLSQRVPWLSQRETQILQLLAQGKSNKAIAQLSNAAEETAKVHLKAILRKTNSQNRTQAAVWAIEH